MKTLISFIVRLVDLVEAEAKSAKQHAFRLGFALALACAAVCIFLGAVGLGIAAAIVALNEAMHLGWALAIMAVIVVVVALGCGLAARLVLQKKGS